MRASAAEYRSLPLRGHELLPDVLSSAKTPSDLTPFNIPWPNSGNSLLKVVIAQKASVIVGLQPVIQVNVVKIGRYHFFAEFVSFRT